jgi:C4-dicarboxylate transporter, DctQ subunit
MATVLAPDLVHPPGVQTTAVTRGAAGFLEKLTDRIGMVAAGTITAVVLLQVAGRLLGHPVSWTEELTRAAFMWMIFIGMAAGMRHADSARVTVFMQLLPPALRRAALPCYVVSTLAFFALMAWTGARMVQQQMRMNESIATLGWPSWVIGMVVPLSAVVAIVCTLASLRDHRDAIALTGDEGEQA